MLKITLAALGILMLSGCTTNAQVDMSHDYVGPVFYGPGGEYCMEYKEPVYDMFHNFVGYREHTSCTYPDGTVRVYEPDVYRGWRGYPHVDLGFRFGFGEHEREREREREREHRGRGR